MLCVWCPAWAVVTACRGDPALVGVPVAVVERGAGGLVVRAASAEARAEGVRVGLRRREAEARCGGLVVLDADVAAEARAFEVVARAMEPITPGLVLERPGVLTFPTRGPSRYFGGDEALAERVLTALAEVGIHGGSVGIADGALAARLAARVAGSGGARVIEPGGSRTFLSPWPVSVVAGSVVPDLLVRLGLPTLGDFAALPAPSVLARFGADGARAHRLAQGLEEHPVRPAPPPPDLVETHEFDPPATRVDEAAFAAKGLADGLLARLAALGLACTHVAVEVETEHGERLRRCWRHEGALTSAALVARVRWQLDGWLCGTPNTRPRHRERGLVPDPSPRDKYEESSGALLLLRLAPEQVIPATGRQLMFWGGAGLWGGSAAATDRADRVLARLQGMLGHDAVVTPVVVGGRAPSERVGWVPWGEPRNPSSLREPPWPGAVPGPSPARVYAPPLPAELLDVDDRSLTVSGRGEASGTPARLRCAALPGGGGAVTAWAGPWAHDVRWWDRATRRRRVLWQLLVACAGSGQHEADREHELACLVAIERGRAGLEAIYD